MPLKAQLNGKEIFSFNYDDDSWNDLKSNYKNSLLTLPCCNGQAIPKTSRKKINYFSHLKDSNCILNSENNDQINLKLLAYNHAIKNGWSVETEKFDLIPEIPNFYADVYCTKGEGQLAINFKLLAEDVEEILKEHQRLLESKIRVLWLYKLKGNKRYYVRDLPYEYKIPFFGLKYKKNTKELFVPQFNMSVDGFIDGILKGNLQWIPKFGGILKAKIVPHTEFCWKCGKETTVILGVSFSCSKFEISFEKFGDNNIAEFILNNVTNDKLLSYGIAPIKPRYSKTVGQAYLSNGCVHCDAIMGNFFITEALIEYYDELPEPILEFDTKYGDNTPTIEGHWYFNERESEYFY